MSTPTPSSPTPGGLDPVAGLYETAPQAPRPPRPPRPADNRRAIVLGALVVLLSVLVALVLLLPDDDREAGTAPPTATPTAEPTPTDVVETPTPDALSDEELQAQRDAVFAEIVRRDPADPTAMGAVDAPVVMVMWADFRCGYCARFELETVPGLEPYVADGTLRIEWRDFPRVTEQSPAIAAAARAAALQGAFWPYHDRVFADQATVETMGDDYLRAVATDLGLDVAQFDADRVSTDVLAAVEADTQQGAALGVSGTPAFMINGFPIGGAQPLETFVAVIEQELARATG